MRASLRSRRRRALAPHERLERGLDAPEDGARARGERSPVDAPNGHESGAGADEDHLVGHPEVVRAEGLFASGDPELARELQYDLARDALEGTVARGRRLFASRRRAP